MVQSGEPNQPNWQDIYKKLLDRINILTDKWDNHFKSFEKYEHKKKHDSETLEWVDGLIAIAGEYEEYKKDYLQYKKDMVQDVMPDIINTPTEEEIREIFDKVLSDKTNLKKVKQLQAELQGGGVDIPIENIIKEIKEPVFELIKKKVHTLYNQCFNKLARDLKIIKDMEVKAPQGRKEGRTEYTDKLYARVRARAMELGYYKSSLQSNRGDIKDILEQLVKEFKADGLNTIDSIKNPLKE